MLDRHRCADRSPRRVETVFGPAAAATGDSHIRTRDLAPFRVRETRRRRARETTISKDDGNSPPEMFGTTCGYPRPATPALPWLRNAHRGASRSSAAH